MRHYIGVDIGTSGCKAVAFDAQGQQIALAYRAYDLIVPQPGWAELDSDNVIERCFEVIREVGQSVSGIRGLGISSQGEAFTPLDADGKTLGNALVSSDCRAADMAASWPDTFGAEQLYQITGHTAHPMFSIFKLLWLREHQPEVWAKTNRFLCFEDLLHYRLGLAPAMGWSLAGRTMLFDVRKHTWSPALLDAVGLRADQLARPLPSGSVVGTLPADVATQLALDGEVVVVTGGHDQTCGALGAGITEPGRAMYATGTVECITPAFDTPVFSEALRAGNLCTYDHTVPGMYATVAFSLTGGNILKWARDQLGATEVKTAERTDQNAYDLLIKTAGETPSPLMVLPYFTPSGTPYFDTNTKGAILGLQLSSTRGQIIRALLEGVAFEMRLNLDLLAQSGCEVRELRAIGGGAKSAAWTQLKADVIGRPISALDVTEAGCLGTAMLACATDSNQPVSELARQWVRPSARFEPNHKAHYAERFKTYRQLYPALRALRA